MSNPVPSGFATIDRLTGGMKHSCVVCGSRNNVEQAGGHGWCSAHRNRQHLLQWAIENEYPALVAARVDHGWYDVGDPDSPQDGEFLWKTAAIIGNDDAIVAFSRVAFGIGEQEEDS